MEAGLEELRLTPLAEELTERARAKLNDLGLRFEVAAPKLVRDDEDPDWAYAVIEFRVKYCPRSFNTVWDRLIREVYKGIQPEEATRVLLVPA